MAMTETEVYEFARQRRPLEIYGMATAAFRENGIDPRDIIDLPAEKQRQVLDRVRGARTTARAEISPGEAALNEAALNALTAQLGEVQGIEQWRPGRFAGAEYPGDDPEDLEFMAELKTLHDAHQPYMDWMLAEQKKRAKRDQVVAAQKAKIMAEAAERYSRDPSRPRGPVMTVQREPDAVLDAAAERCFLEEI